MALFTVKTKTKVLGKEEGAQVELSEKQAKAWADLVTPYVKTDAEKKAEAKAAKAAEKAAAAEAEAAAKLGSEESTETEK